MKVSHERRKKVKTIPKLRVGDILELKKKHPCGGQAFRIMRVGAEVRIVCLTCGHDMTVDRIKLERAIKKIIPSLTTESEEFKE